MLLPLLLGVGFLQPVALLLLLGLVTWAYTLTLRLAGRLMDRRKEQLIESTARTD
jgi:hypothetical protein